MSVHLPPLFTWQDYLDWAEQVSPDATFEEVKRLFDVSASRGVIRPVEIDEEGNFTYELVALPVQMRVVEVVYLQKKEQPRDPETASVHQESPHGVVARALHRRRRRR